MAYSALPVRARDVVSVQALSSQHLARASIAPSAVAGRHARRARRRVTPRVRAVSGRSRRRRASSSRASSSRLNLILIQHVPTRRDARRASSSSRSAFGSPSLSYDGIEQRLIHQRRRLHHHPDEQLAPREHDELKPPRRLAGALVHRPPRRPGRRASGRS